MSAEKEYRDGGGGDDDEELEEEVSICLTYFAQLIAYPQFANGGYVRPIHPAEMLFSSP